MHAPDGMITFSTPRRGHNGSKLVTYLQLMAEDPFSSDSSTKEDDWEKDGDISITSLPNVDISSPSLGSQSSDADLVKSRWARFLGVANRPNPLDDWDQLYNLNNQSVLRNDCRRLAKALDNKKSVPELESFMTLYCKKRNVDYKKDNGWLAVLEKFIKFDLPQDQLFNVFFAFSTKYIPKETKESSQIFDLFRLILQYHDPQICTHLDSLKCPPFSFAKDIFSTLFASATDDSTCRALWEAYIERGDPFLVFYMVIVLIINARKEILAITCAERDTAIELLQQLSTQMTAEDIPDFLQLSAYYAERTPQSVREEFHYVIFGSNYDEDAGDLFVNKLLCLPITIQELTRNDKSAVQTSQISYFVIDCRTQEAYSNGHIYGSFNLDCQLMVDNPSQFDIAQGSLESYKNDQKFEEHICFIGYGNDDQDQFMYMVLARFLRDGKTHVSLASGGYKTLHALAVESNRLKSINSHNAAKCSECNKGSSKSWNIVGKMKEAVISKSVSVKEKMSTLVTSPTSPTEIKHVTSADRHGKKYRNEPSVFSLDDDSSDEDGGAVISKRETREEVILSEQAEYIETFQCHEIGEDKQMFAGHVALTRTHIHILRDVVGKTGYVTTEARHALSTVLKLTSKKKIPEYLTFKFGYEIAGDSKITAVHKFLVPRAGECAKSVKTAIFALRPLTDPLDD